MKNQMYITLLILPLLATDAGKERNGTNDAHSRDKRGPSDSAEHHADKMNIRDYLTSEKDRRTW